MDDMLSQEEINALLNGLDSDDSDSSNTSSHVSVSEEEKDAIGEVSNISMGTAATTLYSLVNQKVLITTPKVKTLQWEEFTEQYETPCVAVQIVYKEGLEGTNLLILKENDVKIIADLMMGGDGLSPDEEINDLHLSAIGEAMNQMIGSAATSMSSMFKKKIDIQPPSSSHINLNETFDPIEVAEFLTETFIQVSFRLQIGDLVDSEIMQLYPIDFAQDIYKEFMNTNEEVVEKAAGTAQPQEATSGQATPQVAPPPIQPQPQVQPQQPAMNYANMGNQNMPMQNQGMPNRNIEVQQAQFQQFDVGSVMQQKENIDLIMDVQLEVTVELGRTHRSIKDILEFAPGTIIELNKLSGEPVDVLVNGKIVAKGEVVVIDENFSIRVTEIMKGKTIL
ncbi:flagellar motor switch phosphatase FliY [Vallitaleaceae bacterium 9-2]